MAAPRARPQSSTQPVDDDAYAKAHRLHFQGDDPALALAALDDYLRVFPDGRFAPEARYNRGIDLLKLHRFAEAREAFRPFAEGAYGRYHRDDASRILRSLSSASAPSDAPPGLGPHPR
jgi:TolA-binding protein